MMNATRDRILDEGRLITDDGMSLSTYFVNLEAALEFRWPHRLPLLAKGSASRYAITNGATVRLSKPEKFRQQGETWEELLDLVYIYCSADRRGSQLVDAVIG